MSQNDLLVLLKKKKNYFQELMDLLQKYVFVGEGHEAEKYILYMQERTVIFEKLNELDALLYKDKSHEYRNEFKYKPSREAELIEKNIIELSKKILEHDRQNEKLVKQIIDSVKNSLREVHAEKNLNAGYNSFAAVDTGRYFDAKN